MDILYHYFKKSTKYLCITSPPYIITPIRRIFKFKKGPEYRSSANINLEKIIYSLNYFFSLPASPTFIAQIVMRQFCFAAGRTNSVFFNPLRLYRG